MPEDVTTYVPPPEQRGLSLKSKGIMGAILAAVLLVIVWISARMR